MIGFWDAVASAMNSQCLDPAPVSIRTASSHTCFCMMDKKSDIARKHVHAAVDLRHFSTFFIDFLILAVNFCAFVCVILVCCNAIC